MGGTRREGPLGQHLALPLSEPAAAGGVCSTPASPAGAQGRLGSGSRPGGMAGGARLKRRGSVDLSSLSMLAGAALHPGQVLQQQQQPPQQQEEGRSGRRASFVLRSPPTPSSWAASVPSAPSWVRGLPVTSTDGSGQDEEGGSMGQAPRRASRGGASEPLARSSLASPHHLARAATCEVVPSTGPQGPASPPVHSIPEVRRKAEPVPTSPTSSLSQDGGEGQGGGTAAPEASHKGHPRKRTTWLGGSSTQGGWAESSSQAHRSSSKTRQHSMETAPTDAAAVSSCDGKPPGGGHLKARERCGQHLSQLPSPPTSPRNSCSQRGSRRPSLAFPPPSGVAAGRREEQASSSSSLADPRRAIGRILAAAQRQLHHQRQRRLGVAPPVQQLQGQERAAGSTLVKGDGSPAGNAAVYKKLPSTSRQRLRGTRSKRTSSTSGERSDGASVGRATSSGIGSAGSRRHSAASGLG